MVPVASYGDVEMLGVELAIETSKASGSRATTRDPIAESTVSRQGLQDLGLKAGFGGFMLSSIVPLLAGLGESTLPPEWHTRVPEGFGILGLKGFYS